MQLQRPAALEYRIFDNPVDLMVPYVLVRQSPTRHVRLSYMNGKVGCDGTHVNWGTNGLFQGPRCQETSRSAANPSQRYTRIGRENP